MCTIKTFINFKTSLSITLKISLVIHVSAEPGFYSLFLMACMPKRIKVMALHTGCLFPAFEALWLGERNKRVFESEKDYQNDIKFKAD